MNYKTKDLCIKMIHVINNFIATFDGFTYYSVSFGIKHANASQQGREASIPKRRKRCTDSQGGKGNTPSPDDICFSTGL